MKKLFVMITFFLTCQSAFSGDDITRSFEFLRTDFSPRTIASGNAFSTLRNDVSTIFINPAGLAYNEGKQYSRGKCPEVRQNGY